MQLKALLPILFLQITFIFSASSQYKFYTKEDSIDYQHYSLIMSKGYKIKIVDGMIERELADSSYLDSDNFIPYDSAIKLSRAIPKFGYSIHDKTTGFSSYSQIKDTEQPDTITHISFEGTQYKRLPTLGLLRFKNLNSIELVGTSVRKIPWLLNWSLFKMDSLKLIRVYNHAHYKTLRFSRNEHIEEIIFRDSPYSPIPKNAHKLTNLREIDYVRNDFPAESEYHLEKFSNLKRINLSRNNVQISKITSDTLRSLENIILSYNYLEDIPDEIGYFKKLEELQLAENEITSHKISPALGSLKDLKRLSFYKNKLDSIPPFIFDLESLEELDFYFNDIEVLPDEIGNLTQLERLYLAQNRLYAIPESLGNLKSLKELYIHHNRISYLPESLKELELMTDFHLQNNYFQGFPEFVLDYKYLEDLDVSYNEIQKLPEGILDLEHLKLLWMKGITFLASSKEEAESIKNTLEALQKKGVKVRIDLE